MVCTQCGRNRSKSQLVATSPSFSSDADLRVRLAYNLSPSFNWKAAMPREEQETYIQRLGKLGYCWQFITLAGLHTTALITDTFAKAYAKHGMRAYGELVQEPEMENGVDVVKHQKWSGANYVDNMLKMVTGGVSSVSAMGKGVTEEQFK
jgi:isocitrate lyase